ncbi:hypothetical protein LCGC14_2831910 [marine sediment metagenome]|uniref:Uncharacterized protein n=1 Tax=marine sediment metagenome TaxID=412755 RepID=A0A0F9B4S0_9ZZZZ
MHSSELPDASDDGRTLRLLRGEGCYERRPEEERQQRRRRETNLSLPQEHYELAVLRHELTDHDSGVKIPCRVKALVFLMMIALTAYYLLQRMYRQAVPADAPLKEQRTTTETILRAFSKFTLILQKNRYGRIVYPTRLTARQRQILTQLGFRTPAQILSQILPRPPPN